jgi:hypothetical protein
MRLTRRTLTTAVALIAIAATSAGVAAGAPGSPSGGSIRVFDYGPGNGSGGKVFITGAIGDFGTSRMVNKSGQPNMNGGYVKLTLVKGTIVLNVTKINAAANRAFNSAVVNTSTCSVSVVFSGPATAMSGTGLYKGVSGTLHLTVSGGFILPRIASGPHAGQCNLSNSAQPTASAQLVQGTGKVSFG